MRIRAITMKPYGAFEERSVTLGPGLSLVVGLNETGKSTALDALTDFLWGIPGNSPQTFLYGRPTLTIRADVDSDDTDGGRTELVRRSTGLTDERTGGDAVPTWETTKDTRKGWRDAFGLSHKVLREGGESLCRGEGDLAELVFAARSGKRIRDLFNDIQSRADELYRPHGNNKRNLTRITYAQFQEAAEREKKATANSVQVETARQAVATATSDVMRAEERTSKARDALTAAERRRDAAPHARALAKLRDEEQQIRDAGPVLTDDQLATHAAATQEIAGAETILAPATIQFDEVNTSRAAIVVDENILRDAAAIDTLNLAAAAETDREARAADLLEKAEQSDRDARKELESITGPTGKGVNQLITDLHVPADKVVQLDELASTVDRQMALLTTQEEAERDTARRLRGVETPDADVEAAAVQAVREAVKAIQADGSATSQQRGALATKADAQKRRDNALGKAGLPAGAKTPTVIPSDSVVSDTVKRLRSSQSDHDIAAKKLADTRNNLANDEQELARLTEAGVPDEQSLQTARSERDGAVEEVFTSLEHGHVPNDLPDVQVRVRRTITHADDVADELRRDATATARREQLLTRIAEYRTAIDETTTVVTQLADTVVAIQREWKAMWDGFGENTPTLDTGPMARQDLAAARDADNDMAAAETLAVSLGEQVAAQTDSLRNALAEAGRVRPSFDLEALLETAEELTRNDDDARESRATRKQLAEQHDLAVTERDRAATDLDAVRTEWRDLLRACRLPDDLDSAGWMKRRAVLVTAGTLHDTAGEHRRQGDEEQQKYQEWVAEVVRLANLHGGSHAEPTSAITVLAERARVAEVAQIEATRLDDEARALADVIEKQNNVVQRARDQLTALQDELNVDSLQAIDDAAKRTDELRTLAAAAGNKLELLRTAFHNPQADERVDDLDEVLNAAVEDAGTEHADAGSMLRSTLEAQADARRAERDLLNASGAAELHALARETLTSTQENAEQYLIARIQATILERELEEYERKNASPLLDEAGTILEQLTEGRWVALTSRDLPTGRSLQIVAADETRHHPEELSEGTADQVYLALRLAGIASLQAARQAEGAPTLPVVFDDVLMTFDDKRAAAALKVMADLANGWQIIVLSHHSHLADLATAQVPAAHVSHLDSPARMTVTRTSTEIRERAHQPNRTWASSVRPQRTSAEAGQNGVIRAWAREQGHAVGDRGRIPQPIVDEYERAHANAGNE